jgi:hypothetical protein
MDDVTHTPLRKEGGDDHSDVEVAMHESNSAMIYEESDEESDDKFLLALAWESKFTELQDYKRIFGNCHVPSRFQESDSLWTREQRQAYQKLLRDDAESNCHVPTRFQENASLVSQWTQEQRQESQKLLKDDEESSMTPYRIRKFSALGLQWNPSKIKFKFEKETNPAALKGAPGPADYHINKPKIVDITKKPLFDDKWNVHFRELVRFREKHGHCMVPKNTYNENPPLGLWVQRQRHQYKLQKERCHSTLTAEQREELDQIGMVWHPEDFVWDEKLGQLRAYKEQYGDCRVPAIFPEHPQLGIWVKMQRRHLKMYMAGDKQSSKMTLERISKLQNMGFAFNPRKVKK